MLSGTSPASPADDNTPFVLGTAQFASTVNLYADPGCRMQIGSGPSAALSSPGIQVNVPDNSATEIFADDSVEGVDSTCTSTPLDYIEESPAGAHAKGWKLKAAKRRCRRKFHGKARHRCIKRAVGKARRRR